MVKPIVRDVFFLSQKSVDATKDDFEVAIDLLDTLEANKEGCVGLAANMIGVRKKVIAFDDEGVYKVMFNPEIIKSSEVFTTEEACLSLDGQRECKRFRKIKVKFLDENFNLKIKTFTGFTAQIIQHEIDHFSGIII